VPEDEAAFFCRSAMAQSALATAPSSSSGGHWHELVPNINSDNFLMLRAAQPRLGVPAITAVAAALWGWRIATASSANEDADSVGDCHRGGR
jgi:hypothetical protein